VSADLPMSLQHTRLDNAPHPPSPPLVYEISSLANPEFFEKVKEMKKFLKQR